MVQLVVRIVAAPGHGRELVQALRTVRRHLRLEDVCPDVAITADVDEGEVVWFWEEWPTVESLEAHVRSLQFSQILALIETGVSPPFIECRLVSESLGLDYLAAVRAGSGRGGEVEAARPR